MALSAAETHLLGQSILADDLEKAVLAHAWPEFDPTKMKKTLPRVHHVMAALVRKYGTAASVHAGQYYRAQRLEAGIGGRATIKIATPPAVAEVAKSVNFAVHSVWGAYTPEDLTHALTNVTGTAQKFALDMGRQTVIDTATADRQARGWARIPSPGACSFCLLLASRGAVYRTDNNFPSHNACRCHTEAVFGAYEPTAQVRAAQALYASTPGGDAATRRNNFRVALQSERATEVARADAALSATGIDDALAAAWKTGDQASADRLMREMDRRDTAAQALPKSQAARYTQSVTSTWTTNDFDDELIHLMTPDAAGWVDQQAIDQVAHLMDVREAAVKADDILLAKLNASADEAAKSRSMLDEKPRRKPRTIDQQIRSDYDDFRHVEWLRAEDECNGVLLNKAGRAAGIDPRTLWEGTTSRARKYASEELKTFWQRNGRTNYGTFRADALGRASDQAARQASTKEGWYDSAA